MIEMPQLMCQRLACLTINDFCEWFVSLINNDLCANAGHLTNKELYVSGRHDSLLKTFVLVVSNPYYQGFIC